jgi:hypothetical protein
MSLVRLFMAARGVTSTRSAASSCVPGITWPYGLHSQIAGHCYSKGGIRNCTERKVNERGARVPLGLKAHLSNPRSIGRGNAGRTAGHLAPTSPELLAVTVRQVDQATQEMSNFGVASAHAELVSPGLI